MIMRRIISLLLAMILVLGTPAVLAEELSFEQRTETVESGSGMLLLHDASEAAEQLDISLAQFDMMANGTAIAVDCPEAAAPQASADATSIKISKKHFPDASFRAYVKSSIDSDGDGRLTQDERDAVNIIDVNCKDIATLEGIEYFLNLEILRARGNKLAALNTGANTKLLELDVASNRLKKLNLRKNPCLTALCVENNRLTAINVGVCPELTSLNVSVNRLEKLDISGNTELCELYCGSNRLKELDVRSNSKLFRLHCEKNQLQCLDIVDNDALSSLVCWNNQLGIFDVAGLPSRLRVLAVDDSLQKKKKKEVCWYDTEDHNLSLPTSITLCDGPKVIYGLNNTFHNLRLLYGHENYPQLTNAQYANFRNISTTGMGRNALYRSSSPIRTSLYRSNEADAAGRAAGIRTFLNLSDNPRNMQRQRGYLGSYYSGQNVCASLLKGYILSSNNRRALIAHFRYMINHEGPYLVHCIYGKDRTGFACAFLECLMGADEREIVKDYMVTYYNFYGIKPNTDIYNFISKKIIDQLKDAFNVPDISSEGVDLSECAKRFLMDNGMTGNEVVMLKKRLAKNY